MVPLATVESVHEGENIPPVKYLPVPFPEIRIWKVSKFTPYWLVSPQLFPVHIPIPGIPPVHTYGTSVDPHPYH